MKYIPVPEEEFRGNSNVMHIFPQQFQNTIKALKEKELVSACKKNKLKNIEIPSKSERKKGYGKCMLWQTEDGMTIGINFRDKEARLVTCDALWELSKSDRIKAGDNFLNYILVDLLKKC